MTKARTLGKQKIMHKLRSNECRKLFEGNPVLATQGVTCKMAEEAEEPG